MYISYSNRFLIRMMMMTEDGDRNFNEDGDGDFEKDGDGDLN